MTLVRRTDLVLSPDRRRVLAKPYLVGEEILGGGASRASLLMARILEMTEPAIAEMLAEVRREFSGRHHRFEELLDRHFAAVAHHLPRGANPSRELRQLIGAYFSHEYSVEAAALFNPSMVLAPDQTGLEHGQRRFVMSLRAVGEGHISSIELRSGTFDQSGALTLDETGGKLVAGQRTPPESYDKERFGAKLVELGAGNAIAWDVLAPLGDRFTPAELEQALETLPVGRYPHAMSHETTKMIRVLAASSYRSRFPADSLVGERVLFPAGPNETRGMEDARFVRFVEDDGKARYYATYTAFDGFEILPQLIETDDFESFSISTLRGAAAQNKGMALFPRRVRGQYVMLSRKDRENLHLSTSTDVRTWTEVRELRRPVQPWELLQIGNCGSPLETPAGWIVLTHGVGPMRRYAIGALLLDLDDPSRVLGCLPRPLLAPDASEREGYVPNVLYSCGGVLDGERIVLPYGFSDQGIRVAMISVPELITALLASPPG